MKAKDVLKIVNQEADRISSYSSR